jgi:outer membrane receptor protein involved in Fe transport
MPNKILPELSGFIAPGLSRYALKYKAILLLLCFFWASGNALWAQNDSSFLLVPERLTDKDILFKASDESEIRVISGTRTTENIHKLPFTTWVITAEDILRNGFVTLADVLRSAPGIRVSQPGNAVEGETFLMRGLRGNQYVKIMINDIPVKPGLALGMPIGSQLPIRQAERIEVVYGPASAIYGNEACAGVVNIILKETERPVYTQADLSFGTFGYNSLDLMFGGKLGRGKNLFRYSIYGSNTVRSRTDVYDRFNANNFNTDVYLPFQLRSEIYINNPNYINNSINNVPKQAPLPHESRLFGLSLRWRGFFFTYHRMGRSDAYALGLNPLSVSYGNSSNQLLERMDLYSAGFKRERTKTAFYVNLSLNYYLINPNSSATFIFDRLSSALYYSLSRIDPANQNLITETYERFSSNTRYAFANSLDLRNEYRFRFRIRPKLYMDLGAIGNSSSGYPLNYYQKEPVDLQLFDLNISSDEPPLYPPFEFFIDANLYSQVEWQGEKLSAVGAINFANKLGVSGSKGLFPRLALLYRFDSTWSVRGSAGTAYRLPPIQRGIVIR